MNPSKQWADELQRSAATLVAIRACVAPSPRQAAWVASTERALQLMAEHCSGVTQAKATAAKLLETSE